MPANEEAIARAAAMGDLSENSEWDAALEEKQEVVRRAPGAEDFGSRGARDDGRLRQEPRADVRGQTAEALDPLDPALLPRAHGAPRRRSSASLSCRERCAESRARAAAPRRAARRPHVKAARSPIVAATRIAISSRRFSST